MAVYPERVNERFRSPAYACRPPGVNGVGTGASFECGCFVRISLAVETKTKTIYSAGFETNGCGFMAAAADLVAEELTGAALADLHSLDEAVFQRAADIEFGFLPAERRQCVRVVHDAVRSAFADHRAHIIEEFRGEKALLCTCFGVAEETIEAFVSEHRPDSVGEVTAASRAGAGCGSCRMLIQEMIDEIRFDEAGEP